MLEEPWESVQIWGTPEEAATVLQEGVSSWNKWVNRNGDIRFEPKFIMSPYLRADLRSVNLRGATLDGIDASRIALLGADLSEASLIDASFTDSHAQRINFTNAVLRNVDFSHAWLQKARFNRADCRHSRFFMSRIQDVSLDEANLGNASFQDVSFDRVSMRGVTVDGSSFIKCNLSGAVGLESWIHDGPSYFDSGTLLRSYEGLSDGFLRKVGIPEILIEYLPSLVGDPIQFYSCFISYSSADSLFADRLYADLQAHGVRCWYAPARMRMGDRIRDTVEQSIRVYDKLIVILSQNSINSDWVEAEVENALERERQVGGQTASSDRPVILIPITLDGAVRVTERGWARTILRQRHIGDFKDWKNPGSYDNSFNRLLRDISDSR